MNSAVNRPKDPALRDKLLERAVQYVLQRGVGGLSLRPLAKHMGTTARMLMHHYGSKEALVADVLLAIEQRFARQTAAYVGDDQTLTCTLTRMWCETAAPAMDPALRAMFEVWGQALVQPGRYEAFLQSMAEPWIEMLRSRFEKAGHKNAEATILAALQTLMQWLDPPSTPALPTPRRKRSS